MSRSGAPVALDEDEVLRRARAGDESAFAQLADRFHAELQLHCYRIVGSVQDAEDLVQETLLAAWRGLERFEGRSSLRSWLYRIATNRCLNALRDRRRRPQELAAPPEDTPTPPQPTRLREPIWLTSCSRASRIAPSNRRPGTRLARRSGSRSSPVYSGSLHASEPCSCCVRS